MHRDESRPLLLQGTLTTFRRRCGKPACRCAAGEPHESPALRFTEDGRTKTMTLTAAEVAQVRPRWPATSTPRPSWTRRRTRASPGCAAPARARRGHDGASSVSAEQDPFDRSRACFDQLLAWLEGSEAAASSHAELEDELDCRGRELLRRMLQDHLDLRALRERLAAVADDAGVVHAAVETGHARTLATSSAPSRSTGWPTATAATRTCTRPTAG